MTEAGKKWIRNQARFKGIEELKRVIPISSVPQFNECRDFLNEALSLGFDGTQVELLEGELSAYFGKKYILPLASGEAALTLAIRLAAERIYGSDLFVPRNGMGYSGYLRGQKVFCQDLSTADMVNPIVYEGGEPVFIDSSEDDWCMDPEVLTMAFEKYPDVKLVVMNHIYGFPGDAAGVKRVCEERGAVLIECAGDALGANCNEGKKAGTVGDYGVLDFGAGKIIGAAGGAVIVGDKYSYDKAKYWATGSQAAVPWNQHEEFGLNCSMSDMDAAVIRGQLPHIDEIIEKKKTIYGRYEEAFDGELAEMVHAGDVTDPNYWMMPMICESNIEFEETRNDRSYTYSSQHGTAAPMEIYDALQAFGVESTPLYKPMSMQPVFMNCEHFTLDGPWKMYRFFNNDTFMLRCDVARDCYEKGIVLPSDVNMTREEQDTVIKIVWACYDMREFGSVITFPVADWTDRDVNVFDGD